MKYAKGIMWLDDCRIPFVDDSDNNTTRERYDTNIYINHNSKLGVGSMDDSAKQGRFTPNLLVCDDMLNNGSIGGGGKMKKSGFRVGGKSEVSVGLNGRNDAPDNYGDKASNSRYYDLDKWFEKVIIEL